MINPVGVFLGYVFDPSPLLGVRPCACADSFTEKKHNELETKVQEFHQKKRKETEREEQTIIDERNNQIKKIKKQRQKESDEYWKGFISKYPLFGISNWLFGKKEITSTTKK